MPKVKQIGRDIRSVTLGYGAFAVLAALYYYWTWSSGLGDYGGDNAYYLLIAKYFSPWTESSRAAAYFAQHNLYPLLYPLLLAVTGGAESMLVAHVVTTTLLLGAFVVFYVWMRTLDFSPLLSTAVTTLFALLPGTYMQALSILSENLYLLLTLGGIAGIATYEKSRRAPWLWVTSFCAAAIPLTRSAGISFLVAYVLYLILSRPLRYRTFIAIAVLPLVLWNLFRDPQGAGYITPLLDNYLSNPVSALSQQLQNQLPELWRAWAWNFSGGTGGVITTLALIVCLAGTAAQLWRRRFDAFYVICYLLLIIVWPFPAEAARFVFVIVPIMLVQGLQLVRMLPEIRLSKYRFGASYLSLAALFLVALPNLILATERFTQRTEAPGMDFRRERAWYIDDLVQAKRNAMYNKALVEGAKQISSLVADDQCVYSIKPSLVGLYAGRVSVVPPREGSTSGTPPVSFLTDECRYFFMIILTSPSYKTQYYPLDQLGSTARILNLTMVSEHEKPAAILAERKK